MIFKSNSFSKNSNILHAFFSRKNGTSKGIYGTLNCGLGSKDKKKHVYQNIEIVKKKIKTKFLFLLHQQHGNKIITLKKIPSKNKIKIGYADGIFTDLKKVAIGILTADCAPVLLSDKANKYICCVHAGWKGAFSGIIKNASILFKKNKIKAKDIRVCVGPCISKEKYEVQLDFYNKFISNNKKYHDHFSFKRNKIFFDLRSFIIDQILKARIPKSNISHIMKDTFANKSLFFSHRRSVAKLEKDYGRNLSIITKSD